MIRRAAKGRKQSTKTALYRAIKKRFPKVKSLRDLRTNPNLENARDSLTQMFYLRNKIAIFSSPRQLQMLRESQIIVCDGTFGYAPRRIYQIYRVFGFVEG